MQACLPETKSLRPHNCTPCAHLTWWVRSFRLNPGSDIIHRPSLLLSKSYKVSSGCSKARTIRSSCVSKIPVMGTNGVEMVSQQTMKCPPVDDPSSLKKRSSVSKDRDEHTHNTSLDIIKNDLINMELDQSGAPVKNGRCQLAPHVYDVSV